MPSPDTVRRRTAFALRGCHYSAQQSDRMCSTAENPSVAQIASCRCSWPGPPAILSGRAITRSNPPQQRSVKIPYLAAMLRKSRLSEPDSSDVGYQLALQEAAPESGSFILFSLCRLDLNNRIGT